MNVTKPFLLIRLLANPAHVIARILFAIYNFQTEQEKYCKATKMNNYVGFSKPDANLATRCVEHYKKFGRLEQWMIDNWMKKDKTGYPRILKYHNQLNTIANGNVSKSILVGVS